jgi:hypothetical protein
MEDAPVRQTKSDQVSEIEIGQSSGPSSVQPKNVRLINPDPSVDNKKLDTYQTQMTARIEAQKELESEIAETSRKIAELENSRISTKWGILTTAVVGGLVAGVVDVLAVPLTCCIVVGAIVGVLAGAVTSYALYKRNCNLQTQIELLKQLKGAREDVWIANKRLIDAYGNLQTATEELNR